MASLKRDLTLLSILNAGNGAHGAQPSEVMILLTYLIMGPSIRWTRTMRHLAAVLMRAS